MFDVQMLGTFDIWHPWTIVFVLQENLMRMLGNTGITMFVLRISAYEALKSHLVTKCLKGYAVLCCLMRYEMV